MTERTRTCVITGCNSGIGKETAIGMVKMGYDLVMLVRGSQKSDLALEAIHKETGANTVRMFPVDLSCQESIRAAAENLSSELARIDVLINNAGVLKRSRQLSADGIEMTLAVNFLAPFLLTNLLLPLLKKGDAPRIVNLSSELYKKGTFTKDEPGSPNFNGNKAYADSKLMLMLFTQELVRRLRPDGIVANAIHPGVAGTESFREYPKWFNFILNRLIPKPRAAAEPVIRLATDRSLSGLSGTYFYKKVPKQTTGLAGDVNLQKEAWSHAAKLTGLSVREAE
jgi:NAD(P)-dependent dehydrogenase (short-subunit alcohol dehydrogenase family)